MPFVFKCLVLLLSIAAGFAADKDEAFRVQPASSYPSKQSIGKVMIAAVPYETEEESKAAFGKAKPYKQGILPVLVVIQNDGDQAIRAEKVKVELHGPNRSRVEAIPAGEVRFANGPKKPKMTPGPLGGVGIGRNKNPLDAWEIEGRAFAAKMILPGESAHGFFYFDSGYQRGMQLYLTGLEEAGTGKELFFVEIPLE
jgi:hypothetical protein